MSDRTRSRYAFFILLIVALGTVDCADRLFERATRVLQSVDDPPKLVQEACTDYSIDPNSLYPTQEEADKMTTGLDTSYRYPEKKWSDDILIGNFFSFGSNATGEAAVVIAIILLIVAVVSCLTIGVYSFFAPKMEKALIDKSQKHLHDKQKLDKEEKKEAIDGTNPESRATEKEGSKDEEKQDEESDEKKTLEDNIEDKDQPKKKLNGGNPTNLPKKVAAPKEEKEEWADEGEEEEEDGEEEEEEEEEDEEGGESKQVKPVPKEKQTEGASKPKSVGQSEKTTPPTTPNPEAKTKERVQYRRPEITKPFFILAIIFGIAAVAMCIQCIVVASSVIEGRPKAACTVADSLNKSSSKNGLQLTYTTFLRIDQAYSNLDKNYQHIQAAQNWPAFQELETILPQDDDIGPNILYPNPKTEILKPMWDVMMPLTQNSVYALRDAYYNAFEAYKAMWDYSSDDFINERARPIHTNLGIFLKDYSELRRSVPVTTYIFRDGSFSFLLADSLFLFFLIPILVFLVRICFRAKGISQNPRFWFDLTGVVCLGCWAIYAGIIAIIFCLMAIQAVRSCNQLSDVLNTKEPDTYYESMGKDSTRFVCKHCLFSTRDNFLADFNQTLREEVNENFLSFAVKPLSTDTRYLNETYKDFMNFRRKPYPDNMAKDIKFDILTMVSEPYIHCKWLNENDVLTGEEIVYLPKVKFCESPDDKSDECTNSERLDPIDILTYCTPVGGRKWDPSTGSSQIINGMVSFNDSVSDYDAWLAKYQTSIRKSYADNIGESMVIPMENDQTISGFANVTDCRSMYMNFRRVEMRVCRDVVAPFKSYAHNFLGFVFFMVLFAIFYILQYIFSLDRSKGGSQQEAKTEEPLASERVPINSGEDDKKAPAEEEEEEGAFKVDDDFKDRDALNRKATVIEKKPEAIKSSIKKPEAIKKGAEVEDGDEEGDWEDEEGSGEEEGDVESVELDSKDNKSSSMGMPNIPAEKRLRTMADKGNTTPGSRKSVGSDISNQKPPSARVPNNAKPKSVTELDEDLYSKTKSNELPQAGRVNNARDGTISNEGSNRSSTSGFNMPVNRSAQNQPNDEDARKSFASISDDNVRIPKSGVPGNLNP